MSIINIHNILLSVEPLIVKLRTNNYDIVEINTKLNNAKITIENNQSTLKNIVNKKYSNDNTLLLITNLYKSLENNNNKNIIRDYYLLLANIKTIIEYVNSLHIKNNDMESNKYLSECTAIYSSILQLEPFILKIKN